MKSLPALALLLLSTIFLTGCIGFVYPIVSKDPVRGTVIKRADAEFIVEGKTTRREVIERFGTKFRDTFHPPALAYSWEKPGSGVGFYVISTHAQGAGMTEWSHWHALFLAFDDQGIVTRKQFVLLSAARSLDEQLSKWAKRDAPKVASR